MTTACATGRAERGEAEGVAAMPFESINPATEALATYQVPPAEVEAAVADARRAFETWRDTPFAERARGCARRPPPCAPTRRAAPR